MAETIRPGRRSVLLVGWVLFLLAALGVLHVLGRGPLTAPPLTRPDALATWVDRQSAAVLAFGSLRLAAMGLAWYLLAATIASLLAAIVGSTRWSAVVETLSPAVVRRVVQGGAGVTMAAAVTGAQAAAWAAPLGPTTIASPVPVMRRLPPDQPSTSQAPPPTTTPRPPAPPPTVTPASTPPTSAPPPTWVIRAGDNLWSVAEATLARAWGRPPSDAEIDGYWTTLITANRARLAHGDDPDLVFPGQVFVLPPAPG
jgi:hypothetical protein